MKKLLCAVAAIGLVQSELVIDDKTKEAINTGKDLDKVIQFLLRPAVPIS